MWWGNPRDKARPPQDAFHGGSLGLNVSAAFADGLRHYDPGRTAFHPLQLIQHDRDMPVCGEYAYVNFGETTAAVVPEACVISTEVVGGVREDGIREQTGSSPKYWRMPCKAVNGSIAIPRRHGPESTSGSIR